MVVLAVRCTVLGQMIYHLMKFLNPTGLQYLFQIMFGVT